MSITEIGREGEKIAREIIKNIFKADKIFQADWLFMKNNIWFIAEIKHQEIYKPPPIYGHGLPTWQANMRMRFFEDTKIRCIFLVVEIPSNKIYWQWLDILENTEYYETTKTKRRIYDIKHFKQIKNINVA